MCVCVCVCVFYNLTNLIYALHALQYYMLDISLQEMVSVTVLRINVSVSVSWWVGWNSAMEETSVSVTLPNVTAKKMKG